MGYVAASSVSEGKAHILNLETGLTTQLHVGPNPVTKLEFSPCKKFVFASSDNFVRQYSIDMDLCDNLLRGLIVFGDTGGFITGYGLSTLSQHFCDVMKNGVTITYISSYSNGFSTLCVGNEKGGVVYAAVLRADDEDDTSLHLQYCISYLGQPRYEFPVLHIHCVESWTAVGYSAITGDRKVHSWLILDNSFLPYRGRFIVNWEEHLPTELFQSFAASRDGTIICIGTNEGRVVFCNVDTYPDNTRARYQAHRLLSVGVNPVRCVAITE